jgi:hypothetical protein
VRFAVASQLKYHHSHRSFTYSVKRKSSLAAPTSGIASPETPRVWGRSALKTVSGGEFDWGGTSVKR